MDRDLVAIPLQREACVSWIQVRNLDSGDDRHGAAQIPVKLQPAMALLLQADDYAVQTSRDRWEFAVEIRTLLELGLTRNDLRWLLRMRYVDQAREVSAHGEDGRAFRPTVGLKFTKRTCFVLTKEGIAANRRLRDGGSLSHADSTAVSGGAHAYTTPRRPKWDPESRELSLAGRVVKRFRWHAFNQERVLAAFEEEDWPQRIDDPLSPKNGQDSKRRLSDTIKWLNRKQQNRLLHFRGDGSGEGVIWEFSDLNNSNGK